ncbi:hypothetical protein BDP81DRAFT_493929 [Colletotrichum phormii]|uniref:Uncharacterized protein n=1 Tax=Colletotrichum phormii TaxID=359342 RepID=A0AAJ0EDC1_9PEZI|nr:uncharacterized protein BDP81DRAFT_493929 [Colletotrichum phormii]KAK1634553.1 hypothetical protein BDP81DRAFT_493929 [Colletotrichum phormii]
MISVGMRRLRHPARVCILAHGMRPGARRRRIGIISHHVRKMTADRSLCDSLRRDIDEMFSLIEVVVMSRLKLSWWCGVRVRRGAGNWACVTDSLPAHRDPAACQTQPRAAPPSCGESSCKLPASPQNLTTTLQLHSILLGLKTKCLDPAASPFSWLTKPFHVSLTDTKAGYTMYFTSHTCAPTTQPSSTTTRLTMNTKSLVHPQ